MKRTSEFRSRMLALRKQGRTGLLPFITAGDPSLSFTEKAMRAMDRPEVVGLEVGVPFSDPLADGPTIQRSSERALARGTTLADTLDLIEKMRPKVSYPILVMSYFNPVHVFGLERFVKRCGSAGVDAVLPTDLPVEEAAPFRKALGAGGIGSVFLAAPTSENDRIERIARASSAFLYYVSLTGVTGARSELPPGLLARLKEVRRLVSTPLAVGFGVSRGKHVKALAPHCDAVVVGSAIVRSIEKGKNDRERLDSLHVLLDDLVKPLRKPVR